MYNSQDKLATEGTVVEKQKKDTRDCIREMKIDGLWDASIPRMHKILCSEDQTALRQTF